MTKNSRQKFNYLENEKSYNVKEEAFLIIFKGLSLEQIKTFFLEVESSALKNINENLNENSKMDIIMINVAHFLDMSLFHFMLESDIMLVSIPMSLLLFCFKI